MEIFLKNNLIVELRYIIRFNRTFVIDAANEHDAAEKEQLLREWTQEPFPDLFNKWCIVCYYRDYEMYPLPTKLFRIKSSFQHFLTNNTMICKIFQIESSDNIIFKLILSFRNRIDSDCYFILLNNINNITNILNEFPYNESPLLRTDPVNNWSKYYTSTDNLEYAHYKDDAEPWWESISGHQYLSYKTTSFPNCELLKEQEVHRERGRGKRKKHRSKKTKKLGNL